MKWPCSGYWQSYCLWSERSWLVSPVKQHDAGNLRTSLGRWPPGWICIPWDHGIILNLCLSDSLENLRCHFKVAGTEFSSLWHFFCFFHAHFLFWAGGRGWYFVSLETWSFWWTHPAFLGRGVVSLLWKCSPHSVSPELAPLSLMWLLFVNLRPKNLNAVTVTGPTGFVWPWCRDGYHLLPERRQFHRWRWGQAKGWRPGIEPTSAVTSPGKYDAGGWQGCQKALFLTWSPPCNLTAAVGLYADQPTHL